MQKVKCYKGSQVIGVVDYVDNLDTWDGNNYTSGRPGRHIGINKTKSGEWYVCYGTQWQGEQSHAKIITEEEAKQLCIEHDHDQYSGIFGEDIPEV